MSFSPPRIRRCAVAIFIVALSACASGPSAVVPGHGDSEVLPFQTEAGEASYHLLLAELALERGQYAAAASEYRKAAELSEDASIADRAVTLSMELGRKTEALASARRWVELAPDDRNARRYLAQLYLAENRIDEAVEAFEQLLPLLDEDPEKGFLPLAGLLLDESEQKHALKVMQRLLERHRDVAAAHYGYALLSLQVGDFETAQRYALQAQTLRPDWHHAGLLQARAMVAAGDVDGGIDRAGEVARRSEDPELRLDYALLLAGLEREGEARLELDLLLDEHPRMAGALRAAGLLEMRRGDLNAAQLHFTSLLATGRNIWEAFFYLGTIAEQRGQHARAVRYYTQVRDGDLAVPAQVRAAALYELLDEGERGVEHLQDFAGDAPKFDAEISIAAGEMLARRGERERALELFDDTIARHPGHRGARFARAFLLEAMDQLDLAITELRALLREDPDDATALNALGYTLADRTDRQREAYRLIRKAYELEPDNPAIVDSMGWVQFRRGRLQQALEHLERAYAMLPDPEVAAHLGEVLYNLGRTDEAALLLNGSLAEHEGDETLLETIQRLGL